MVEAVSFIQNIKLSSNVEVENSFNDITPLHDFHRKTSTTDKRTDVIQLV